MNLKINSSFIPASEKIYFFFCKFVKVKKIKNYFEVKNVFKNIFNI